MIYFGREKFKGEEYKLYIFYVNLLAQEEYKKFSKLNSIFIFMNKNAVVLASNINNRLGIEEPWFLQTQQHGVLIFIFMNKNAVVLASNINNRLGREEPWILQTQQHRVLVFIFMNKHSSF